MAGRRGAAPSLYPMGLLRSVWRTQLRADVDDIIIMVELFTLVGALFAGRTRPPWPCARARRSSYHPHHAAHSPPGLYSCSRRVVPCDAKLQKQESLRCPKAGLLRGETTYAPSHGPRVQPAGARRRQAPAAAARHAPAAGLHHGLSGRGCGQGNGVSFCTINYIIINKIR